MSGLITRRLDLPEVARERGFTRLRLVPRTKTRTKGPLYSVGHVLFDEAIDATETIETIPEKGSAKREDESDE